MSKFSENLAAAMEKAGLTSKQMAELTGIDKTNFSRMLHGRCNPSYLTICRVLRALPTTDARTLLLGSDAIQLGCQERQTRVT